MKVYLIRHGEDEESAEGKHNSIESPLSAKGIQQAEFLADRFVGYDIDLTISSSSIRTVKTAEIIKKVIGGEYRINDLFRQLQPPSELYGKDKQSDAVKTVNHEIKIHSSEPEWHYSDEENLFDLRKRAIAALEYLKDSKKETVIVVTHGSFLAMLLAVVLFGENCPIDIFTQFRENSTRSNTGINVVEYTDKWKLLQLNDDAHLGELG